MRNLVLNLIGLVAIILALSLAAVRAYEPTQTAAPQIQQSSDNPNDTEAENIIAHQTCPYLEDNSNNSEAETATTPTAPPASLDNDPNEPEPEIT